MKKSMLFLTTIVLMSCSKEDGIVSQESEINHQEVKAKEFQSMREFQSMEEFFDYYSSSTNPEFFDNYSNNYNESDSEDEDGANLLSPILRNILNENNEFKIADTIVKLKNKKFYKFNYQDREEFEGNMESYVTDFIGNTALNRDFLSSGGQPSLATLKLDGIGGSHQHEFYKQAHINCATGAQEGPSGRKLKYVHELVGEYVNFNGMIHAGLFLDVKLEWNPSGNKWRAAGERRIMNVNIQGSASIVSNGSGNPQVTYNYNIGRSFNCAGDQHIFIEQFDAPIIPKQYHWDVTGSGLIKHSISNTNIWNDVW